MGAKLGNVGHKRFSIKNIHLFFLREEFVKNLENLRINSPNYPQNCIWHNLWFIYGEGICIYEKPRYPLNRPKQQILLHSIVIKVGSRCMKNFFYGLGFRG